MFTIEGGHATAVCYATQIEPEAVDQICAMCDQPFTRGCSVRIMPDAHAGKGCTVGTTMTVRDAAVPNVVGVDIGCGMYTVSLGAADLDLAAIDRACHRIPSGFDVREKPFEAFDLSALRCRAALKDTGRLARSLGTLGGGNHFIEVDVDQAGSAFLVVHSGSRNLGVQVAEHYQRLAVDQRRLGSDYAAAREAIVADLRAQGRERDIEPALRDLRARRAAALPDVPDALCWLEGDLLADYLHDVALCQAFARRSREIMAHEVLRMAGLRDAAGGDGSPDPAAVSHGATDARGATGAYAVPVAFHTVHNYIDVDEKILRKGAIAAHEGECVLIPLNMRDGAVLARGKGNPDWNFSAPHGAGRLMSRSRARATLTMDEYRRTMEGVYTTCVCEGTLDESPMAYKPAGDILEPIAATVDVLARLRPVYNFKATNDAPRFKKGRR